MMVTSVKVISANGSNLVNFMRSIRTLIPDSRHLSFKVGLQGPKHLSYSSVIFKPRFQRLPRFLVMIRKGREDWVLRIFWDMSRGVQNTSCHVPLTGAWSLVTGHTKCQGGWKAMVEGIDFNWYMDKINFFQCWPCILWPYTFTC